MTKVESMAWGVKYFFSEYPSNYFAPKIGSLSLILPHIYFAPEIPKKKCTKSTYNVYLAIGFLVAIG